MQVLVLHFHCLLNLLKTTKNRKKTHNKIAMLARSKLNNEISHEDFMIIINEERNYGELKESIRMMKGQEDKK